MTTRVEMVGEPEGERFRVPLEDGTKVYLPIIEEWSGEEYRVPTTEVLEPYITRYSAKYKEEFGRLPPYVVIVRSKRNPLCFGIGLTASRPRM